MSRYFWGLPVDNQICPVDNRDSTDQVEFGSGVRNEQLGILDSHKI